MTRLVKAFFYSWSGLKLTFRSEPAFRLELILFIVLAPIALCLDVSAGSRVLMIFSMVIVLIVELVNTAIEVVIDRISTAQNPLSKKAKDIGSAIVLLSLLNVIFTWFFILYEKF